MARRASGEASILPLPHVKLSNVSAKVRQGGGVRGRPKASFEHDVAQHEEDSDADIQFSRLSGMATS
jgi:hypothetical protein